MFHVFSNYINWTMLRTDSIQLNQILMLQFPAKFTQKMSPIHSKANQTKKMIPYVMTFASSMKSSSDIVPPFIIFTAVSIDPRHLPRRTTPNWPEPNSSSSINSDGCISHLSCDKPAVGGTGRSHGDDFNRHARPPEL